MVASPLVALMKDKVAGCSSMDLSAGYINVETGNEEMQQGVLEGKYQLVFMSPESLFTVL